jgi:hypothetical protein
MLDFDGASKALQQLKQASSQLLGYDLLQDDGDDGAEDSAAVMRMATAAEVKAYCPRFEADAVEWFDRKDALGHGVCAKKTLLPGTRIISYGGAIVPRNETSGSMYSFHLNRKFMVNGDPSLPESRGHLGSFVNDAAGPIKQNGGINNAAFGHPSYINVPIGGANGNGVAMTQRVPTVLITVTKKIAPGAEVFVSYGRRYWKVFRESQQSEESK